MTASPEPNGMQDYRPIPEPGGAYLAAFPQRQKAWEDGNGRLAETEEVASSPEQNDGAWGAAASGHPCFDCPWSEPGDREEMIDLMERGETYWPCHFTAIFDDETGFAIEEPRNHPCVGKLRFDAETSNA